MRPSSPTELSALQNRYGFFSFVETVPVAHVELRSLSPKLVETTYFRMLTAASVLLSSHLTLVVTEQ